MNKLPYGRERLLDHIKNFLIDIDICTESKFKQLQEEHQKALHDWIDVPSVIGEL